MIAMDKHLIGAVAGAIAFAAIGGFTVARCTAESSVSQTPPVEEETGHDGLTLSTAAIRDAGIRTMKVGAGGLDAEIVAHATVVASPAGDAIVTARAGGAVVRILKRLGDPVRAGEALAIVESRDAAQITADRGVAAARTVLAQRSLARERMLYDQKVSPRVDLERAEAEAASAAAEAHRAQAAAGAANVTLDGRGVIVASPIAGRVTETHASLGAFVQPETLLFRVADPLQIQIEAAIGAIDAARTAAGDRAAIDLPDGRTIEARVRAVTPTLNGETRSATAVLDAADSALLPGLALKVRLMPASARTLAAVAVPEEAVQSVDGRDVVFVRTRAGFRAVPVGTGRRSAGRIEIVSGLASGMTIATAGAFLLKAELGKAAGGEH